MTGIEASADPARGPAPPPESAPTPSPHRPPWRLPASRGGMAWLAVVLIVGTLVAVQFGRQVYTNWEIGQQAARIHEQIAAVEAENAQLERELAYLRSDAYVSAEARRLANLGNPGDEVLIIPPGAEAPLPADLSTFGPPKPMLEQWWELFFGPSD